MQHDNKFEQSFVVKMFPKERYKKRLAPPDLIVCHWTGSNNPASSVYHTLMTRKNKQGKVLGLGIDFIVDEDGTITCCNPAWKTKYTAHAGVFNKRSIGIEIVNYGIAAKPPKRGKPRVVDKLSIHGKVRNVARFHEAQVQAVYELCAYLCQETGIPFDILGGTTTAPVADFRGIVGHFHLSATKNDPGPLLLSQLKDRHHTVTMKHRITGRDKIESATSEIAEVLPTGINDDQPKSTISKSTAKRLAYQEAPGIEPWWQQLVKLFTAWGK